MQTMNNIQSISSNLYDQQSSFNINDRTFIPSVYQNYTYVGPYPTYVTPTFSQLYSQNQQSMPAQNYAKYSYDLPQDSLSAQYYATNLTNNQDEAKEFDSEFTTEEGSDLQINKFESKDLSSFNSPASGSEQDEDELILSLGKKYKNDWKRVSKKIYKLKGKKMGPTKLRDHYKSLTKGTLPKRVKFTHQEDLMIAKQFAIYGCEWEKIASHFPTRTPMMIKNRYYSFIRKKSLQEDLLTEANGGVPSTTTQATIEQVVQQKTVEKEPEVFVPREVDYFADLSCKRITSVDISLAFPTFSLEDQLHHRITSNETKNEEFNAMDFISYGTAPYMTRELKSISLEPNFVWNFQL